MMGRMFSEKYYEDEADDDEHEIEIDKGIDMNLLNDKAENVEPDAHGYLQAEDKIQNDFEEKMGRKAVDRVKETA